MKSFSLSLLFPLLAASHVAAHGFVQTLTVNGKDFKGNEPSQDGQKTKDSVIKRIDNNSPVKGAKNDDVNCGTGAGKASNKATQIANAMPGDEIKFDWVAGGGQNWPHDTGPMLTYMASCGDETCDKFDSKNAKWFKIQQVGLKQEGKWAQADLMTGAPAKVTLPKNLKAGNYLIRHEIIALHLAEKQGGAEFYPSCSQLSVGGNENGVPDGNELVSLPGAYSDTDKGIKINVFNDLKPEDYPFPGPKIASFVDGSSSSSADSPAASKSASGAASTSGKSKGSCSKDKKSKKKRSVAAVKRPRQLSRVMRGLTLEKSQ